MPEFGKITYRPEFVNPFERQHSTGKVPTLATIHAASPLVSSTTSTSPDAVSPPTGWRNRAASIFQSISSDGSNKSSGVANLQQQHHRPSIAAARKPSYVPKYAARAHMSTMAGRTSIVSSSEIEDILARRGSRMMSVSVAGSASSSPSSDSSSSSPTKGM